MLKMLILGTVALSLTGTVNAQEKPIGNHLFPETETSEWMRVSHSETHGEGSPAQRAALKIEAFGSDENAIRNQLGKPNSRYVREFPNRHDKSKTNTLVTLEYEGLAIRLLQGMNKTFVTKLYIDNCQLNSPFQRYLCQPVSHVTRQLGPPNVTTETEIIYTIRYGDVGWGPLRMGVNNGQVEWISTRTALHY